MDPISRPSSTSTQNSSLHHSASLPQLPGLSALASIASTSGSPQLRYVLWRVRGVRDGKSTLLKREESREVPHKEHMFSCKSCA